MSGFRKSHSTTAILLKLHYDILKSMNRGEITVAIFADFSKAFDRYKYVQIKEKPSSKKLIEFGVPQGTCRILKI